MGANEWSEETESYDLGNGFRLDRADPHAFAVRHVLYQGVDPVFLYRWDRAVAMLAESVYLAKRLFWIRHHGRRVGGTIAWPNTIAGLFLEPPYADLSLVLRALIPQIVSWSDPDREVTAASVLPAQREHFERAGFRLQSATRCMVRPTEAFDVGWDDGLRIAEPAKEHEERLVELAHLAHTDRGLTPQTLEDRRGMIRHYLTAYGGVENARQASTLIVDQNSEALIGACLISLWEEWPLVFDLVVHPERQGRGIARRMLQRALTTLHPIYPVLRLFVGVGNSAESLYYRMGFVPGPALANLKLQVQS